MPKFSPADQALLEPFVTDTEADVYAVKGPTGLVGAVYARYSRAPGGFRETLLKEFLKNGQVDATHAQDLIERVLVAYGDDSVGELEGTHVSFENISILATKEIEDRRIGGSPIEQSTRYVFFDQRDEAGRFRYYRDPQVMASSHAEAYVETMDFIFQTYCDLIEPMKAYYGGLKPMDAAEYDINGDGVKERLADLTDEKELKAFRITYNNDLRSKACDTLRYLLPIATKTNVGVFGNGRFFQNVISHCLSHDLPEVQEIADRAKRALDSIMPSYVKRAKANGYLRDSGWKLRVLATDLLRQAKDDGIEDVRLLDRGEAAIAAACAAKPGDAETVRVALQEEADDLAIACMLYPAAHVSLDAIRAVVRRMPARDKKAVIDDYIGDRKTRRDRPGRALESGYPYTFDMCTDFGTYKDLMRHRMSTQLRQRFTPMLGFAMPPDLVAAGHAAKAEECVRRAQELYARLAPDFPAAAAYATLHGSLVRWVIGMNDRPLMHLIELRTQPAGHPSYRKVAQKMQRLVAARSKWRGDAISFVNHEDVFWSRADSEAKQRVKEKALDEK